MKLTDEKILRAREAAVVAARDDLLAFAALVDPNYRASWHHAVIASAFERFVSGDCPQILIIDAPPGSGKSDIVSRKGPAWGIGRNPSLLFAIASYSADLAESHSQDSFNLAASDRYREIFPDSRVGLARTNAGKVMSKAKEWRALEGGGYKAVGRKGGLTGRHPARMIIDDPFKDDEEAQSKAIRDKVWDWFLKVVLQRMGAHGKILVMNTRWHRDDLVGRILELKKNNPNAIAYEHISLPARMDEPSKKNRLDPRGVGEPLWPWYYAGGKPGTPRYDLMPAIPADVPHDHPDRMSPARQLVVAKANLSIWEATDAAGFSTQGQGVPAPKSAYGAHAYHGFHRNNIAPRKWLPLANRPVIVCMDFNYSPMCSTLFQVATIGEIFTTAEMRERWPRLEPETILGRRCYIGFRVNAFKQCKTSTAVERIVEGVGEMSGTGKGEGFVYNFYPDAAANSRTAHDDAGASDLKIIEATCSRLNVKAARMRIKPANPKRKDSLNAVNEALSPSPAKPGQPPPPPLLFFVAEECEVLFRDFRECGMEEFLNGNYNDDDLGHSSDGVRYFINYEHPLADGRLTYYTTR